MSLFLRQNTYLCGNNLAMEIFDPAVTYKSIDDINFEIPKRDSLKKVHFLKYNDKDDPFEK